MHKFLFGLFITALLAGCATGRNATTHCTLKHEANDYLLGAALYQQVSAEYKMACRQAYQVARMRVDEFVAAPRQDGRPRGIVVDVDETVLDNSPYQVELMQTGKPYESKTWTLWVNQRMADSIAGSVSFLRYAASKGLTIWYVTNRSREEKQATLDNLNRLHFPYADEAHVLTKENTSSKEERRKRVDAQTPILLLVGDQLGDFYEATSQNPLDRAKIADTHASDFGKRYILVPNAMYGEWLNQLYLKGGNACQADSSRRANVHAPEAPKRR